MIYQFDQFELDTKIYRLRNDGTIVDVEPKVFELLSYLIANRDRLVTRDELFENLWPGQIVSETSLSNQIKAVRKAIGDDGKSQSFIKTVHGRGYQFVYPANEKNSTDNRYVKPETRYAQNGNVSIAYQAFGEGLTDLIVISGWLSNLDIFWEQPRAARFFLNLANFCRVILIDRRGTGLSDRVSPPNLELQMQDIIAVMESIGCRQAVLMGYSEGGNIAAQFAVTFPRRTLALVLIGTAARWIRNHEYPYGSTDEEAEQWITEVENAWGGPIAVDLTSPSLADDKEYREWYSKYFRSSASKTAALELLRMSHKIDQRSVLPTINVPALVLQATGDLVCPLEAGRDMARRIPDAKFVQLNTDDHLPYIGCRDEIISEIRLLLEQLQSNVK